MLATIKHGDDGELVQVAKYLTKYCSRGNAKSAFDAGFVAHVCTWQRQHELTPDGVIGAETWSAIAANAPTCSTAKNQKSAATNALQILLDAGLEADGIFGAKTKAAVAAYQASSGLIVDGVCGVKTWSKLVAQGESEGSTAFHKPVDYKQADSRWGKKNYTGTGNKSQTMANSGCGPTAMADVIATLVDPKVTPWDLAQKAMKWGDRTASSGTAVSFFRHIQEEYGFKRMVSATSLAALKACLDAGGYVVCRMGKGYWTNGGHYICAWKYDATDIYCNDPASSKRTHQKASEFIQQRKDFWCFYPERK